MGFESLIRAGIKTADTLTKSLQVTVQHYPYTGVGHNAKLQYGTAVSRKALVEKGNKYLRTVNGKEITRSVMITLLGPVASNGATGRTEPIDPRDKFVLPDGTTGPVVDVTMMLIDPASSVPYLYQVSLG